VKDKICTLDPKESALKLPAPKTQKILLKGSSKSEGENGKEKENEKAEDDFMTFQST